jgi:hypothetical protein
MAFGQIPIKLDSRRSTMASSSKKVVHFLYILRCADGSLYIGETDNIEQRVERHQAGRGCAFTAKRRPLQRSPPSRLRDSSSPIARRRVAVCSGQRPLTSNTRSRASAQRWAAAVPVAEAFFRSR